MLCSALGRTIIISHVIRCVHMLSLSIAGINCWSWISKIFPLYSSMKSQFDANEGFTEFH